MSAIRILLIEGETAIAEKLSIALRKQLYDLDVAPDCSMGKEYFDNHGYDVVVLEHYLSDGNGCDFCRYIREKDCPVPVLLLGSREGGLFEGFAAGADDYVSLPVDCREFLARVQAVIKRYPHIAQNDNRIRAGDIVLDLDSKEVRKGGRQVMLTLSEFLLLEFLMRNKNKVLSREEIAFSIWSADSSRMDRIQVHINNLRKKLNNGTLPHGIYTVSRRGYLLMEQDIEQQNTLAL